MLQHALDMADNTTRIMLANELRGHVREAVACSHANHVLQKCITALPPAAVQWIVDEIYSWGQEFVVQLAEHRFGCRIFQRLLEHCSSQQLNSLVSALVNNMARIAASEFGHYVMLHLLEFGTSDQRACIAAMIVDNASWVGSNFYASAVVAQCLAHSEKVQKLMVATALLSHPMQLQIMAGQKFGHLAIISMLQMPEVSSGVRVVLMGVRNHVKGSQYWKLVVKHFQ